VPSLSDRIKEYSATPSGKIVVVAVPVAVLVLIVAVVVVTVLGSGGTQGDQAGDWKQAETSQTAGTTETTSPASPSATSETVEPPINQDYEVYETRDPFKQPDTTPTPSSTSGTGTSTSSTSSSSATPAAATSGTQVLALQSVSNQNGVLYANVQYGSQTYLVKAGDRVGTSPYQVTSVSTENATFLYGDDSLTLAVGQDVQK